MHEIVEQDAAEKNRRFYSNKYNDGILLYVFRGHNIKIHYANNKPPFGSKCYGAMQLSAPE